MVPRGVALAGNGVFIEGVQQGRCALQHLTIHRRQGVRRVALLEDRGIVVEHRLVRMLVIGRVLDQYLELQMVVMDLNPAVTAVVVAVAVEVIAEVPAVAVDPTVEEVEEEIASLTSQ